MIILLALLSLYEPMSPGIHTPHEPMAARCKVAESTSANGKLTVRVWEPRACPTR